MAKALYKGVPIYLFRMSMGLTLQELSASLGVDQGILKAWESGEQLPRNVNLIKRYARLCSLDTPPGRVVQWANAHNSSVSVFWSMDAKRRAEERGDTETLAIIPERSPAMLTDVALEVCERLGMSPWRYWPQPDRDSPRWIRG